MSLIITDECIICDVCNTECPNDAITKGQDVYDIDPDLCTESVGYFESSRCVEVCPIDCITADPLHKETQEQLYQKYTRSYS